MAGLGRPSTKTSVDDALRTRPAVPNTAPGIADGCESTSFAAPPVNCIQPPQLCLGYADPRNRSAAMSEPVWNKFLTERDKAVFAAGGFGARAGFGKRPALLVIDVNWAFCGEHPEPILETVKRWRTSCGEAAWGGLRYIEALIKTARTRGLPVVYTTGERRSDNWDAGSWRWKSTRGDEAGGSLHDDIDGNQIVTMIAPGPRDIVVKKQKPSGFFGTN